MLLKTLTQCHTMAVGCRGNVATETSVNRQN